MTEQNLQLPRALLFDVDRTLSNTRGEITPATVTALEKLAKNGYLIGVCTGRSYAELKHAVLPLFPPESWHIVSGGAQVVSLAGEIAWQRVLVDEVVREIATQTQELGAEFGFSQGNVYAGTPQVIAYKQSQRWPVDTVAVESLDDWTTCLLTIGSLNSDVETYIEGLVDVEIKAMVNSLGMPYYDITPHGITKREGAEHWAEKVGVAISEIGAFGDSENDLEVLPFVGTGFAMGNAIPELKAVADHVIGHADEDGIAEFVENLLQN